MSVQQVVKEISERILEQMVDVLVSRVVKIMVIPQRAFSSPVVFGVSWKGSAFLSISL